MVLIDLISGARPNYTKIAPLYHVLRNESWCRMRLIHTGQHYDADLSDSVWQDLELPPPDHCLGVGSGPHAEQTGKVMMAYEQICLVERPDLCIVPGDVNSTLACALAAKKLQIKVAHLEAGLRNFDLLMPEEINRVLTDRISDLLWTPSSDADENLKHEGITPEKIRFVGNIVIDSLEKMRPKLTGPGPWKKPYVVFTLHRPSNVDDEKTLRNILETLEKIAKNVGVLFPMHPRTKNAVKKLGWPKHEISGLEISTPMGYLSFLKAVWHSEFVITDSGGIQEEASYLGIPCLTLRENTERPITLELGTNRLVTPGTLLEVISSLPKRRKSVAIPFWDGKTAFRVASHLREVFSY